MPGRPKSFRDVEDSSDFIDTDVENSSDFEKQQFTVTYRFINFQEVVNLRKQSVNKQMNFRLAGFCLFFIHYQNLENFSCVKLLEILAFLQTWLDKKRNVEKHMLISLDSISVIAMNPKLFKNEVKQLQLQKQKPLSTKNLWKRE